MVGVAAEVVVGDVVDPGERVDVSGEVFGDADVSAGVLVAV